MAVWKRTREARATRWSRLAPWAVLRCGLLALLPACHESTPSEPGPSTLAPIDVWWSVPVSDAEFVQTVQEGLAHHEVERWWAEVRSDSVHGVTRWRGGDDVDAQRVMAEVLSGVVSSDLVEVGRVGAPLGSVVWTASTSGEGSPVHSGFELTEAATRMGRLLARLPGVQSVGLRGAVRRRVTVVVDGARLSAFGLLLSDIVREVEERTPLQEAEPRALASVVLDAGVDGRVVRLGDVADVREEWTRSSSGPVLLDGQVAVTLDVVAEASEAGRDALWSEVTQKVAEVDSEGTVRCLRHSTTDLFRLLFPAGTPESVIEEWSRTLCDEFRMEWSPESVLSAPAATDGWTPWPQAHPKQVVELVSIGVAARPRTTRSLAQLARALPPGGGMVPPVGGAGPVAVLAASAEALEVAWEQLTSRWDVRTHGAMPWVLGREACPELQVELRKEKALALGLGVVDAARQVQTLVAAASPEGLRVVDPRDGQPEVVLRWGEDSTAADVGASLHDVDAMRLSLPDGAQVPLGEVASLTATTAPLQSFFVDGQPALILLPGFSSTETTADRADAHVAGILPVVRELLGHVDGLRIVTFSK